MTELQFLCASLTELYPLQGNPLKTSTWIMNSAGGTGEFHFHQWKDCAHSVGYYLLKKKKKALSPLHPASLPFPHPNVITVSKPLRVICVHHWWLSPALSGPSWRRSELSARQTHFLHGPPTHLSWRHLSIYLSPICRGFVGSLPPLSFSGVAVETCGTLIDCKGLCFQCKRHMLRPGREVSAQRWTDGKGWHPASLVQTSESSLYAQLQ